MLGRIAALQRPAELFLGIGIFAREKHVHASPQSERRSKTQD
jgi:hypothetical protein